jgi:hypothetical protein
MRYVKVRPRAIPVVMLVLCAATGSTSAQEARGRATAAGHPPFRSGPTAPLRSWTAGEGEPSTLALAGGGLLGGAAGFFGGGFLGAVIACDQDDAADEGFCAIGGFVVGASIGESALIPLGVHVANGRRGSYGLSLLASAAIAGVGLAAAIPQGEGAWLIPVPLAQIASSIAIERATARRAAEDASP